MLVRPGSLNYSYPMEFEWDEAKSDACLEARGFDFAYAASAFADPNRMIRRDNRYGYGEDRFQLVGRIERRVFVVVFTPRTDAVRIVSARKANKREVRLYEDRPDED